MQERAIEKTSSDYPEIGKIGKNLSSLKDNVGDLVSHVKEEGISDIAEIARNKYENITKFGEQVAKKVREQPAKSMLIAFAGGLLASYLFGRR